MIVASISVRRFCRLNALLAGGSAKKLVDLTLPLRAKNKNTCGSFLVLRKAVEIFMCNKFEPLIDNYIMLQLMYSIMDIKKSINLGDNP